MLMIHYKPGDVLVTAFPFADQSVSKRRPVLCVAHINPQKGTTLYWVVMITSTENKAWLGDINIEDFKTVGLPVPSIVRTAKIACIDGTLITKKVGTIDDTTYRALLDLIEKTLSN